VASTDGSKRIESAKDGESSDDARSAAEQRRAGVSTSEDPEVLAEEIERTREDLSETLDAIADKVSPKRVADRTKERVGEALKEGSDSAKETLRTGATAVKGAAVNARAAVEEKVDAVKAGSGDSQQVSSYAAVGPAAGGLHPVPPAPPSPWLTPPALAGATAALLVVLFVLRRRRRR
jgi:hypothetical protein